MTKDSKKKETKFQCGCGAVIHKKNIKNHCQTTRHLRYQYPENWGNIIHQKWLKECN